MAKKKKGDYKVEVYIPDVDSMELQTQEYVKIIRDPEDNLLYLIDVKTKGKRFKELFPGENKQQFNAIEVPKIKERLQHLREKKKKVNRKSTENYLNIDDEIYQQEFLLAKYNETKGSFAIKKGQDKVVTYIRKPTGLYPLHYDIHSNKAFSPTESQTKEAFLSYVKKYENLKVNPTQSFEKITLTIAAIVLAVLVITCGVLTYKLVQAGNADKQARQNQIYVCQSSAIKELNEAREDLNDASIQYNSYVEGLIKSNDPILQTPQTSEIK